MCVNSLCVPGRACLHKPSSTASSSTSLQASQKGYTDIVRELLQYGAEVNMHDLLGHTALHQVSCWVSTSRRRVLDQIHQCSHLAPILPSGFRQWEHGCCEGAAGTRSGIQQAGQGWLHCSSLRELLGVNSPCIPGRVRSHKPSSAAYLPPPPFRLQRKGTRTL